MREEYDFSQAKRASEIPHLARLQKNGDDRNIVMVPIAPDILTAYREAGHANSVGLDAWVNRALREWLAQFAA